MLLKNYSKPKKFMNWGTHKSEKIHKIMIIKIVQDYYFSYMLWNSGTVTFNNNLNKEI